MRVSASMRARRLILRIWFSRIWVSGTLCLLTATPRSTAQAPQTRPASVAEDPAQTVASLRQIANDLDDAVRLYQAHVDREMALYDRGYHTKGGQRIPAADADFISGPADRRPGRRTSSGRPQLRRDRRDLQPRGLATAQASRHLQRPDGPTRFDRRRTDRGQARDPEDHPSPSPGRMDDQRTRRRNRRAPRHDLLLGSERAPKQPLGRSAGDLQQTRHRGRGDNRQTQSRPRDTPAIPPRPAS